MTEGFSLKEAVDLFHALTATKNELWTLFIVVGFGIVGFALGKETKSISRWKFSIILSVAFFGFAYSNHDFMIRTQKVTFDTVIAIHKYLERADAQISPEFIQPLKDLTATKPEYFSLFHWGSTLGIMLAIWIPPLLFSKNRVNTNNS